MRRPDIAVMAILAGILPNGITLPLARLGNN